MSEQDSFMARRIQQGVDHHREALRQEQETQEQRDREKARALEFGRAMVPIIAQAVRENARETARMLTDHGIVPDSEIETPAKFVGYEFIFPSLAKAGIRKWKRIESPPTTRLAWLIITKRMIKTDGHFYKGEYVDDSYEVSHSGIGMDAQGDLIDIDVGSRRLIDRGPASDKLLIPDGIVIGKVLEDQPGLSQWRHQLENLGVAKMTDQPYEPLEIVKKT